MTISYSSTEYMLFRHILGCSCYSLAGILCNEGIILISKLGKSRPRERSGDPPTPPSKSAVGPGLELRSVSKALQFPDLKPQPILSPSLQLIVTQEVERHWPGAWESRAGRGSAPKCWVALGRSLHSLGLTVHIHKGGGGGLNAPVSCCDRLWMCAVCTEGWYHVGLTCVPRAWGGPWLRRGLSELSLTVGVAGSVRGCTVRGHCRLQVRG